MDRRIERRQELAHGEPDSGGLRGERVALGVYWCSFPPPTLASAFSNAASGS